MNFEKMHPSQPVNTRIESFAPVVDVDSEILILGSMPGAESLRLGQYYANPRNAFWQILASLTGNDNGLSYVLRLKLLNDHRIALWDVLRACERSGSLDSAIKISSIDTNDFQTFLANNSRIRRIFFNGAFAETAYRKHVLPGLAPREAAIPSLRLPSSSPANAGLSFEDKLRLWQVIFD